MSLKEDKQLNFENQNIFVGIDAHLRQWTVIRIAKKLLSRMSYVWRNQTKYTMSIVE